VKPTAFQLTIKTPRQHSPSKTSLQISLVILIGFLTKL